MKNLVPPYPAKLKSVTSLLRDRKQLAASFPKLEEIRLDVIRHIRERGSEMPASIAVMANCELLKPVLEPHWQRAGIHTEDASSQALVLYLPPPFASELHWFTTRQPDVFNSPQLNLRDNTTYIGWWVDLKGEAAPTTVQLPVFGLRNALCEGYRSHIKGWGWMSVVVVSGDNVAVGGFLVEDFFLAGLQAAEISAQSCRPEEIYPESELKSASKLASVHGLEPWVYGRWYKHDQWVLQPEIFGFTE